MNDTASADAGPTQNRPHLGELTHESMDDLGWNVERLRRGGGPCSGGSRGTGSACFPFPFPALTGGWSGKQLQVTLRGCRGDGILAGFRHFR